MKNLSLLECQGIPQLMVRDFGLVLGDSLWYKSHHDVTTQKLSSEASSISMSTSQLASSLPSSQPSTNSRPKDRALAKRSPPKQASEPDPEELKDSARSQSKQLSSLNDDLVCSPVSNQDFQRPEPPKISNQVSRSTIEEAPVSEEASLVVEGVEGHSVASRGTSGELKVSISPERSHKPLPSPCPIESLLLTPSISK